MKNKIIIIFILSIAALNSKCQQSIVDTNAHRQTSDTVAKDIPMYFYKKLRPISAYQNKIEIASKLKLDSLEAGFDSLQMRLWYENSSDTGQLIILKCHDGKWNSKFYTFTFDYNKNEKTYDVNILKCEALAPKSGWRSLLQKLFDLKITTLPDEDKLKNYLPFFHGVGVAVEIATQKLYRFYRYQEPQNAQYNVAEAKNVEKISELLEYEFNFKRLHGG